MAYHVNSEAAYLAGSGIRLLWLVVLRCSPMQKETYGQ
jgi:hypothetical protein